jgi:hypothetical protein
MNTNTNTNTNTSASASGNAQDFTTPLNPESTQGAHDNDLHASEKGQSAVKPFAKHWGAVVRNALKWTVRMMLVTSFIYFFAWLFSYLHVQNQCDARVMTKDAGHLIRMDPNSTSPTRVLVQTDLGYYALSEPLSALKGESLTLQNRPRARYLCTARLNCAGVLNQ